MTGRTFAGVVGASFIALLAVPMLAGADDPEPRSTVDEVDNQTPVSEAVRAATASVGPISASRLDEPDAPQTTPPEDCDRDPDELDDVRRLIHYRDHDSAHRLLESIVDADCFDDPEVRDRARFQHAYVSHLQNRPETVLQRLDDLETEPPVLDYVRWLRARALEDLDRPGEAADVYRAIYEADDSPMHYRARARQSKALADANRYDELLPVVDEIIDLFPDYPRRHRALYDRARALEQLDRLDEAAEAYQKAQFEFPYKDEGRRAGDRLRALADDGVEPTPIDYERRYERYRRLSIEKFWDLAHDRLTGLRDEVAAKDGYDELENEILQRIALNTYRSHDHEGAAEYFAEAIERYEAGNTDGLSKRTIYRFHNFALARLGRFDEARQTLEKLHENAASRTRNRAIAEFYERYGRYEEAYQLYEDVYYRAQRRGWHFSYLKYKTGRFQEAYDNLRRLARRSGGQTRAKYMYWAARSLERSGNEEEAAELFTDIHRDRPDGYYGIQSGNRLLDIRQRSTVDDTLLAQAERVSESADAVFETFEEVDRQQPPPASARTASADPRGEPLGSGIAGQSVDHLSSAELMARLEDDDCRQRPECTPSSLGLPFPTYGLSWNLGQPLMDARMADHVQPVTTRAAWEETAASTDRSPRRADRPTDRPDLHFEDDADRVRFNTDARIYWNGRHDSDIEFANYEQGQMLGPSPDQWTAYDDPTHHGGLERAVDEAGDLFPALQRARWLWLAGWYTEARRVIRDVSLEFRLLRDKPRPSDSPHELSYRRWQYHIDNRPHRDRADFWGMDEDDDQPRFPVPDDADERDELLERQQQIYDRRDELRDTVVEALQEVGDYHMVRQFALDNTWWLRSEPTGEAQRHWKKAYPRAFPEQVIPLAQRHNVNPYMIWALMLTESSFNPDSLSVADALGLLQVLPRTGHKIADLFGADDFGPFDLLEEQDSIEQGIFYFSKLVRKFHSQELLAFAGYNGGPHRVSGWLDMRGQQMPHDEFIEEIPFDESRNYAKKVLRYLHIYLDLYDDSYDGDGLYVGQNLRTDYLAQPDF